MPVPFFNRLLGPALARLASPRFFSAATTLPKAREVSKLRELCRRPWHTWPRCYNRPLSMAGVALAVVEPSWQRMSAMKPAVGD